MESNHIHLCTRRFSVDAAHRVLEHESKCASLHGHSWVIEVTCMADRLDSLGRVIDFGKVKEILGSWLDEQWDHTTLLNKKDPIVTELTKEQFEAVFFRKKPYLMDVNPTAENMASHFFSIANSLLNPYLVTVPKIRVYETQNCFAEYESLERLMDVVEGAVRAETLINKIVRRM